MLRFPQLKSVLFQDCHVTDTTIKASLDHFLRHKSEAEMASLQGYALTSDNLQPDTI